MESVVKIGSVWTTANGEKFVVWTKSRKNELVWVIYRKENSFDTYSCLESSFIQHFTEIKN